MSAKIDSHWQYYGLRAVVLENRWLRIIVLPDTSGRIYSIVHKPSDTEFLWHHPRIRPSTVPFGASFDDTLVGGWDDLLPTVEACHFRGENLPDHGELWSLPWDWRAIPGKSGLACLYTEVAAPITPVRFERWLKLSADQPVFQVRYRLTNLASYPVELIWGIHPMFAITADHRLDLPPGPMVVDQASAAQLGQSGQQYDWPFLPAENGITDMRALPPAQAGISGGHYAIAPSEPWFALTDKHRQVGIAVTYPASIFPALWLWMSYGGWRGLYHLAIEPWTGYPINLAQAAAAGRQTTLDAGQRVTYHVNVGAYSGLRQVTRVEQQGSRMTVLP